MAKITAKLVKQLREKTNAGMMECKKALEETDGDIEKAVDVLRERGVIKAAQKAGRATNEGTVAFDLNDDCTKAGIVEVACETDFASSTDEFQEFAHKLAKTANVNEVSDLDAFLKMNVLDTDVAIEDAVTEKIHTIGENMKVAQVGTLSVPENKTGFIESYNHMNGKIGVLVLVTFDKEETHDSDAMKIFAHDVALQIAASSPEALDRESIDKDLVNRELEIYKNQARESGKPENIQEKIAKGKLEKFYKENALIEQEFIKDSDETIESLNKKANKEVDDTIVIADFIRFQVGETESDEEE